MLTAMYIYFQIISNVLIVMCNEEMMDIIDLTKPTTWTDISDYYMTLEKRWKMCVNCGISNLGTAMHMGHSANVGSLLPAMIPSEYLLTKLIVIDVTTLSKLREDFVLTLEEARQWMQLRHDPIEPTLLLFKFGWTEQQYSRVRSCVCKIPGISYDLAEWISANLSHVVGVATDAPTLESQQTREFIARTVSNKLGSSGVYIIENVQIRKKMPENGCMALAMPLKLLNANYVPTRLTALCPAKNTGLHVTIALTQYNAKPNKSNLLDINLEELIN